MANHILTFAPTQITDNIRGIFDAQRSAFAPFAINLTEEEKRGARSMSQGRAGLAQLISGIATANENALARHQSAADLSSRLAYDVQLEGLRQRILGMLEAVTETQLANSIDIMDYVDKFSKILQANRNDTAGLDLAMREVDEYNARFANTPDAPPTP